MAGTNLEDIKKYPFPVESYKDYLDSTDRKQANAAKEIQRLIKSGQIDSSFRTTKKYDEARQSAKDDIKKQAEEFVTTGVKKAGELPKYGEPVELPKPYAGTVIGEVGKAAADKRKKAEEARAAEERRRNQLALEDNRPVPFPQRAASDAKAGITTGKTGPATPSTQRGMTPTEIALKARPELAQNYWDALKSTKVQFDGGKLVLEDGNIGYIGVDVNGNAQIISQTKFLQNIRSMSVEERRQFQNKIKSAYGSAYDGPTNGSNDFAGKFENAAQAFMERFTQINYDNFSANGKPVSIDAAVKSSGGGGFSSVSRNITTTDFTPEEAKTILDAYYQDSIGRRATADEVAKFTQVLKKQAKSRPTVTTSTTVGSTTRTSTKAGFGQTEAQALAQQEAEATPEYKPFQLATRAYDAFDKAIANMMIR